MNSSPVWVEALKMVPSVVTAGTAVCGLIIARAGLNRWHRETIGRRRIELAEEFLASFYRARDILRWARAKGEQVKREEAAA